MKSLFILPLLVGIPGGSAGCRAEAGSTTKHRWARAGAELLSSLPTDEDVDNVITRSGQGWKSTLGLILVVATGLVVMYGADDTADAIAASAVVATFTAVAIGLVVTLSLRCPDCRARWIWIGLSHQDHNQWLRWLMTLQACPECGYRGPADARGEPQRLQKRLLFGSWRDFDRDSVLGAIFILPTIIILAAIVEGGPWNAGFWGACVVAGLCLAFARRPAVLPAAAALYIIGPVALYAAFSWRLDAILISAASAATVALAYWWTERPERTAAAIFALDRRCPGCSRPLGPRRLSRPVIAEEPRLDHWLHQCDCGELSMYKPDGSTVRVYDPRRPSETGSPQSNTAAETYDFPAESRDTMPRIASSSVPLPSRYGFHTSSSAGW